MRADCAAWPVERRRAQAGQLGNRLIPITQRNLKEDAHRVADEPRALYKQADNQGPLWAFKED
jgi:hypothetical protein